MWPRIFQFVIGLWLAMSPIIFEYHPLDRFHWVNTLVCAAAVAAISLLALAPGLRRIYLLTLVAGLWLVGVGFLAEPSPPSPALQNYIVVGLLLLMFGILPSPAHEVPKGWQAFHQSGDTRPQTSP
jgi:hypothetical protein